MTSRRTASMSSNRSSTRWDLPRNRKALVENVTDFYHVPFVHKNTIAAHTLEPPDIRSFGDYTCQRLEIANFGWRRRFDQRRSRGGPCSNAQASVPCTSTCSS